MVAVDRPAKFALAQLPALPARVTRRIAADFLRQLVKRVPDKIHPVLTGNGILNAYNFAKRLKTLQGLTPPSNTSVLAGKKNRAALMSIHTSTLWD